MPSASLTSSSHVGSSAGLAVSLASLHGLSFSASFPLHHLVHFLPQQPSSRYPPHLLVPPHHHHVHPCPYSSPGQTPLGNCATRGGCFACEISLITKSQIGILLIFKEWWGKVLPVAVTFSQMFSINVEKCAKGENTVRTPVCALSSPFRLRVRRSYPSVKIHGKSRTW